MHWLVGLDLRRRVANRLQINSDAWQGFLRGVLDEGHGKMDYAVQIKKYDGYSGNFKGKDSFDLRPSRSPGRCIAVKTLYITGNAKRKDICSSHAERFNLSLRHFNKRFTRLSPCFSKKLANLEHSVALTVAYFNFCRPHGTFRLKGTEAGPGMDRTPPTTKNACKEQAAAPPKYLRD